MINPKTLKSTICILVLSVIIMMSSTGYSESSGSSTNTYKRALEITSASDAKNLLVEGNQRFVSGKVLKDDLSESKRKDLLTKGQHPFAVIVSCSDSRVPPEIIFDQGLGDLFIVRDAGNIVDSLALGSVEYGAEHLHAPLIIVLGHENCGAIKATVDGGEVEGNIKSIVAKIKPAFEKVKSLSKDKNVLYEKCEDENIKNTVTEINNSLIIKKLKEEKKINVIGAKYDIDTGKVNFLQ